MTAYIFENLGKKMWESLKRTFCPLVSEHMFFFTSNIIINGLEMNLFNSRAFDVRISKFWERISI